MRLDCLYAPSLTHSKKTRRLPRLLVFGLHILKLKAEYSHNHTALDGSDFFLSLRILYWAWEYHTLLLFSLKGTIMK